jgi:hypothetical protein
MNLGTRLGSVVVTPRPVNPQEGAPVPFVQEVGWAPGQVSLGVEKRKCLTCIGV